MSAVVITAHHERTEARALAMAASRWLNDRGHRAWMLPADAKAVGLPDLADDASVADADLLVSLGGDGTMLRRVDLAAPAGVPVLGVNVGLLGYLTEVEPAQMTAALERFFGGGHTIEERMMLSLTVVRRTDESDERVVEQVTALNEAVLEREDPGHTVRLAVSIDGEPFITYAADGLIVATPTGSTAYSLSARGPIISPRHRALLLTPVSPHMLFDRSLVLSPEETVGIEVLGHRRAALSIDGRSALALAEGDTLSCVAAERPARLVRLGARHFHQILKAKFGLTDR